MTSTPLSLLEFPADDPERARRFWSGLLGVELRERAEGEGSGWQTRSDGGGAELGSTNAAAVRATPSHCPTSRSPT